MRAGLAPVYLDFMQQIVTALKPLNRKLLFWGDIAQDSPELVKALPQSFKDSTIAIAWGYNPEPKGFAKLLTPFTNAGFETWVSPEREQLPAWCIPTTTWRSTTFSSSRAMGRRWARPGS